MLSDVTVFNIREYLSAKGDKDLGEDELRQILSGFLCDKNFEEFTRERSSTESRVGGTGLGMPIVKRQVIRMTSLPE